MYIGIKLQASIPLKLSLWPFAIPSLMSAVFFIDVLLHLMASKGRIPLLKLYFDTLSRHMPSSCPLRRNSFASEQRAD